MSEPAAEGRPSRTAIIAAFAAVYLIWGSTYLAIRFAIETLPPFLMAGTRFLIAGALVYGWLRLRGATRPSLPQWRAAAIVGGLLLLGGNGLVVWAEQWVPSGVAAVLVATVAFWMVLADWLRPGGTRPGAGIVLGLVIGFAGIGLLVGPGDWAGGGVDLLGAGALVVASCSWAMGSIYSRGAPLPRSPLLATGMEMLTGGALLCLAGVLLGEVGEVDPQLFSTRSLLAFAYLIVFGSLIGFSAYIWLLGVVTPAKVATYAYVNPMVAVLLGWALAGEVITARMVAAVVIIVGAVAVITTRRTATASPPAEEPPVPVGDLEPAPAPVRRWPRSRASRRR